VSPRKRRQRSGVQDNRKRRGSALVQQLSGFAGLNTGTYQMTSIIEEKSNSSESSSQKSGRRRSDGETEKSDPEEEKKQEEAVSP